MLNKGLTSTLQKLYKHLTNTLQTLYEHFTNVLRTLNNSFMKTLQTLFKLLKIALENYLLTLYKHLNFTNSTKTSQRLIKFFTNTLQTLNCFTNA